MNILGALVKSLNKNKKWIIIGAIIYLTPLIYRLGTQTSFVPILDSTLFLYHQNSQIIPVNFETLRVLFIIPAAVGAIIGASFLEQIFDRRFAGLEKYLARVFGSLGTTFAWIALEFIGYSFFNPAAPWGNNIWIGPSAYVKNILIALIFAPLVPYVTEFVYSLYKNSYRRR